jgi:hypothetical protein
MFYCENRPIRRAKIQITNRSAFIHLAIGGGNANVSIIALKKVVVVSKILAAVLYIFALVDRTHADN